MSLKLENGNVEFFTTEIILTKTAFIDFHSDEKNW